MNKKILNYWRGIFGEYYAMLYLLLHGYKILKRRYKTKFGEIDIIGSKADNLIAFEVKTRNFKNEKIEEAFNQYQFYRISNALKFFLNKNEYYSKFTLRIDAILIYNKFKIKHIKNVWFE